MRRIFRWWSASLLLLWACGTQAAEIEVKNERPISPTPNHATTEPVLRLTGMLREGDSQKLRSILTKLRSGATSASAATQVTVELSSLGGDLHEGLRAGYLFREFDVATVVRKGDICMSACALAFLGGAQGASERAACRRLEVGGKLGFHSFWLNPNSAVADDRAGARQQGFTEALAGAAAVVRYAADLNIDSKFVAGMLATPSDAFVFINTVEDFLTLGICPAGIGRPPISPAEQALNICGHSMGWAVRAKSARITAMTAQQARRYILENVQQNMILLDVKGALTAQLASYSVMRDERAIDNLYADLRAAGVRLPRIVGPVFEVEGYQVGEGETQCFVSLSLDDPDQFQVAVRRPKIWAHPGASAPNGGRRLFLYGKDAVINPRP